MPTTTDMVVIILCTIVVYNLTMCLSLFLSLSLPIGQSTVVDMVVVVLIQVLLVRVTMCMLYKDYRNFIIYIQNKELWC